MLENSVEPLIIQQCKFLEQVYHSNLTTSMVEHSDIDVKQVKKELLDRDRQYIMKQVTSNANLKLLLCDVSWRRLWDSARDFGIRGAKSISAVLRVLTTPVFSDGYTCHLCDFVFSQDVPPALHFTDAHLKCDIQEVLSALMNPSDATFDLAESFKSIYCGNFTSNHVT